MPLIRVITARELMQQGDSGRGEDSRRGESIGADTALEDLVPRLAAGAKEFAVIDADGRRIGTVHAKSALAVLERDRRRGMRR